MSEFQREKKSVTVFITEQIHKFLRESGMNYDKDLVPYMDSLRERGILDYTVYDEIDALLVSLGQRVSIDEFTRELRHTKEVLQIIYR